MTPAELMAAIGRAEKELAAIRQGLNEDEDRECAAARATCQENGRHFFHRGQCAVCKIYGDAT